MIQVAAWFRDHGLSPGLRTHLAIEVFCRRRHNHHARRELDDATAFPTFPMTLDWAITCLIDDLDFCWMVFLYGAYTRSDPRNMDATAIECCVDDRLSAMDDDPSAIDRYLFNSAVDDDFDQTALPLTPARSPTCATTTTWTRTRAPSGTHAHPQRRSF